MMLCWLGKVLINFLPSLSQLLQNGKPKDYPLDPCEKLFLCFLFYKMENIDLAGEGFN